jgi:DNA endonuclease
MMLHKIPLEKRIKLYDEALELHDKGFGVHAIEERFRSLHGYSVASTNISKWIYHGARPDTRANMPDFTPSPQLSYFLGAFKGDGFKWTNPKRRIFRIGFRVKDKDFAQSASNAIAHVLRRRSIPLWTAKGEGGPNDLFHTFTVESWALRAFLKQGLSKLLTIALRFPREFLRGIFDAEGWVGVSKVHNRLTLHVGIAMSNKVIIQTVRSVLINRFGIAVTGPYLKKGKPSVIKGRHIDFKRDVYDIRISTHNDVRKFSELVSFSIKRKREKLGKALQLLRTHDSRTALSIWEEQAARGHPKKRSYPF